MTKGRTCLILKDKKRGNETSNFRLITCISIMWKVFIGLLAEQVYGHIEKEKLLSDEQKGCRRQSRGTKDQLMIGKMVMKNCKKRMTNLSVAWIDYMEAYDMVPHTWILWCLKIFKTMKNWKVQLTLGEVLGEVKINRDIFLGESLSPILFVMTLILLSILVRNMKARYL